MMKKIKLGLAVLSLCTIILVTLAGCGQSKTVSPASTSSNSSAAANSGGESKQLPDVKLATVSSGANRYIADYVKDQGLDKSHGFNLVPVYMDLTTLGNALKLNAVDVNGALQPSTAAVLKSQGTDVSIFGPVLWSGNSLLVPPNAQGTTLADFKGKRLGNFTKSSGAFFFTSVLAASQGLDQEKDFKLITGEAAALNGLLQRGDLDIIVQYEPFTSKLVQSGQARVLVDMDKFYKQKFGSKALKGSLGARTDWIKKNPKVAAGMRDAFIEASQRISRGEDRSFFDKVGGTLYGLAPAEMDAAYKGIQANFCSQWDEKLWSTQKKIIDEGKQLGLLPANATNDVFTNLP